MPNARTAQISKPKVHKTPTKARKFTLPSINSPEPESFRKISTSQESLATKYSTDKNLAFAIYNREAWENAFSHNATRVNVVRMIINKNHYLVTLHNGDPFPDVNSLREAFYPNTSCGTKGANGCGGMLSPLLLVKQSSHYHHMIYSRQNGETMMWHATIQNDRTVRPQPVSKTFLSSFERRLDYLLKDKSLGYNVAYVSRYEPNPKKISQTQQLLLAKEINPDLVENGRSVCFYDHLTLEDGKTLGDAIRQDIANNTYHYQEMQIPSREAIDQSLSHATYTFKSHNCQIKNERGTLTFDAEFSITLYAGLKLTDRFGKTRYDYLHLRGDRCGHQFASAGTPEHNTFITLGFQNDPTLGRLNRHPSFVGRCLSKAAQLLNVNIRDNPQQYENDIDQFPELLEATKIAEARLGKNKKTSIVRIPHARISANITKIIGFRGEGSGWTEYSQADLRNMLGNTDELFMVMDRPTITKAFTEMLTQAADDPDNAELLASLKTECNRLWPSNFDELAALPLEPHNRVNRLKFTDPTSGKPITSISPNCRIRGVLSYGDGNGPVNPSVVFIPYGQSKNSLAFSGEDNEWNLDISNLWIKGENGFVKAKSTSEWSEAYETSDTLPTPAIRFQDQRTKVVYTLNTHVDLPIPEPVQDPEKTKTLSTREAPKIGKTMYWDGDDAVTDRYINVSRGEVKLNRRNQEIGKIFLDIAETKHARERVWSDLVGIAQLAEQRVSNFNITPSTEAGTILQSQWGELQLNQYMINQIIHPFMKSKPVQDLLSKIESIIGLTTTKPSED